MSSSIAPVIPDLALIDNSEERVPLVLCLDCSGSMADAPIAALNAGLKTLENTLKSDVIAAKRVRILVIRFGDDDEARVERCWTDVRDFTAPCLDAHGSTPTGAAVRLALREIEDEKLRLRAAGIAYKRPLLYLMSDGEPTDAWKNAAKFCREAEAANKVSVFPIAVGEEANLEGLGEFSRRRVLTLDGIKFKELFLWLSASVRAVSSAQGGAAVQLAPTDSWATTSA